MEEKPRKLVKPSTFKYIVLNKSTDGKTLNVLMPISQYDIDRITDYIKREKRLADLNGIYFYCEDIIMIGEAKADTNKVNAVLERVCGNISVSAPAVIDLEKGEHSIGFINGCSMEKFYHYNLLLIGNPENVILFKHYGKIK